jgi:hypothetical protein
MVEVGGRREEGRGRREEGGDGVGWEEGAGRQEEGGGCGAEVSDLPTKSNILFDSGSFAVVGIHLS